MINEIIDIIVDINDIIYERNQSFCDEYGLPIIFSTNGYAWSVNFFDAEILSSESNSLYDDNDNLIDIKSLLFNKTIDYINNISKIKLEV